MYFKHKKIIILLTSLLVVGILLTYNISNSDEKKDTKMTEHKLPELKPGPDGKIHLTDEEWKARLTDEQYRVLRKGGTELCGTGIYYHNDEPGKYYCAGCGAELFTSDTKFESGSGWPSFFQPVSDSAIIEIPDHSHGMNRTEIRCARCGGHLGHVFEDGPPPTGLRYCINSVSLNFIADSTVEKK